MRIARAPVKKYFEMLVDAASDWGTGSLSDDYKGYDKIVETLSKEDLDTQMEKSSAWVGRPEDIIEVVHEYDKIVGGFDDASMQVNFASLPHDDAVRSVRLFGEKVIPHFARG